MRLQIMTKDDCCENVLINASPVEFLVLNKALKRFIENKDTNSTDRKIAESMNETEIEFVEVEGSGNGTEVN